MTVHDAPLRHVARPMPPWDTTVMTMCGRLGTDVPEVDDLAGLAEHLRAHGRQRTAFVYCMTCIDRAAMRTGQGPGTWQRDPAAVTVWWLERRHNHNGDDQRLRRHLYALASLVSNHEAEYERLLANDVPLLDTRRRRV